MDYLERIKMAIDFIEKRLEEELSSEKVADYVGFSPFHFHRIFQAATRETITDYIRKRRLTHAAFELLHSNGKIIDLAIKYRFESQEAFTRSFKKMFLYPPGRFRQCTNKKDTIYQILEKRSLNEEFLKHLQNSITLEPSYEWKEGFQVVGMEVCTREMKNFRFLWKQFISRLDEIENKISGEKQLYGVIEPTGRDLEFHYISCAEVEENTEIPEGMVYKSIPSNTYAVFIHKGPVETLMNTLEYIYGTWFPKSGKIRADGPEFGLRGEDYRLYIPIMERSAKK